jgi:hypothetical protein
MGCSASGNPPLRRPRDSHHPGGGGGIGAGVGGMGAGSEVRRPPAGRRRAMQSLAGATCSSCGNQLSGAIVS